MDPSLRRLYRPRSVILGRVESAVLAELIRAEGSVLSRRVMGAAISTCSDSHNPENVIGVTVSNINRRVNARPARIANVRRFGYRLLPAEGLLAVSPEDEAAAARRARVEAILVEQFEATGPHARLASKLIEEVYG